MEKVKIKGFLKSEEQEVSFDVLGFYGSGVLKYQDGDVMVSIDLKNNCMVRTASSYELIFNFKQHEKTVNVLKLIDLNQTIEMSLNTIDLLIKDGYYYVQYELNDDELFTFELFYEFL